MGACRRLPVVFVLMVSVLATGASVGATRTHGIGSPAVMVDATPEFRVLTATRPPGRPRTVEVAGRDRAVRVTWAAPTRTGSHPIDGYVVQTSIDGDAWTTATVVAASQRSATIGSMPTALVIRVRVAARSRGGTSEWSAIRSTVLPTTLQVSGGATSTCAVLPSRTVACWGQNSKGQLGIGNSAVPRIPVPVVVPGLTDVREIASGRDHHCARRGDGSVWCWGDSVFGQLTIASVLNHAPSPVRIPGIASATQIAAGSYHTCIRTGGGGVQCWGSSDRGQLGGPIVDGRATVDVSGVAEIRAGGLHTCARLTAGTVRCWGLNTDGESGGAPGPDRTTPFEVPALADVRGLALGERHSCAVLADGTARCWGDGESGQLGDGSTASSTSVPQAVVDLGPIASLTAGQFSTCARYRDASVRCWGSNFHGNLGTGTAGASVTTPALSELGPAIRLGGGASHACSTRADGRLRCTGRNHEGQLGDGSTTNRPSPVPVQGL